MSEQITTLDRPASVPHSETPKAASLAFSDDERARFRAEDFGAARLVVMIMTAVFSFGLLMYLVIAILAMGGPS